MAKHDVLIVGAGIGGLTLGLRLHQAGIPCRIFEAAPEIKPLGVGINLLPHASKELTELGLQDALAKVAITTAKIGYYNRFGQLIYNDPCGRYGGYEWPMFSIHRGDLQMVLLAHSSRARAPTMSSPITAAPVSSRMIAAPPRISSTPRPA
jgi:5-methylphenazine-1-carboxylate 1-monooxygenase